MQWQRRDIGLAFGVIATLVVTVEADDLRFNRDVRPILSEYCFHCHGPDEKGRKAGLRLDVRDEGYLKPIKGRFPVQPGDPDASEIIRRITAHDVDDVMPPKETKRRLAPAQIETLKTWIRQGASWQRHWAFESPVAEEPPVVQRKGWVVNPIDAFVLASLERQGLAPSPEAERARLLRRVSLDLIGLPPTPEEVEAFIADEKPGAYERVVDRLLVSPRYGERMAWEWLDAARYADTNGYQGDNERTMWPWRDWVIRAYNENLPYDQFLTWQLAGDLLPNATDEQKMATGFFRNHMINGEGGRIAEENRVEYIFDQVETVGAVWLGLTYTCARCHDHKYDPISHRDYYAMFDFFNQTPVDGGGGNPQTPPVMEAPTPEQRDRIAAIKTEADAIRQKRDERAGQIEAQRSAWERQVLSAADSNAWTVLKPGSATARYQQLEILKDASVLAKGPNPENDFYDVILPLSAGRISALRLEALRHRSMTGGGLARSDSGNFVLTQIALALRRKGEQTTQPIQIGSAVASYEQGPFKIEKAFDGNPGTGWAVYEGRTVDRDHEAVFRLAEPFEATTEHELVISLRHDSPHRSHNLGRFRFAATSVPDADLGGVGEKLTKALRTPSDQRSKEQKSEILEAFRRSDSAYRHLADQLARVETQLDAVRKQVPRVMVLADRAERRKTHVLQTGLYNVKLDAVEAQLPSAFARLPEGAPKNRLSLAQWMVDPSNPLTARVVVNREWQRFFGAGLVKTVEDFGSQGDEPSHPALLDWLAIRFTKDWDGKALHRLIVTSATYRQSAKATLESIERDPENRWLSRGVRYRLPSWMIRDQALALAGLLVEKQGGPSVMPYQPDGVWAEATFGNKRYKVGRGEDLYRRSLYTYWRRIVGPTMFFDVAKRQNCEVKVARTNTPLHALVTLNDITYVEAARVMAQQIMARGAGAASDRLAEIFYRATARQPSDQERQVLSARFEALKSWYVGHPEEAVKLLNVGAAPRDETLNPVEHAAYAGVCAMVLNLDEVLNK